MVPSSNASVPEQPLVVIGDVTLTEHWLVTPSGSTGLAGTEIFVTDFTRVETKTPTWAIVLAIIASLLAGLYPTWRACRIVPAVQLKTQ
jgi:ABC-type lipoprotein release transport system permease subunit